MSNWQKVLIAFIASILLNAMFVFSIGLVLLHGGDTDKKPLEKLKLVQVTVATPTPIPAQPLLQLRPLRPVYVPPVIDSDDLHKTDKIPKNPVFQSDQNLAAGGPQPATGNVPLPSQNGKERKELAFNTQRYTAGNGEGDTTAPPVMELAPAPAVQPKLRTETTPMPLRRPTPLPTPTPEPTPMPTPKVEPTPAAVVPTPTPTFTEEPIFQPTPVPTHTVAPAPDIARPTPVPTPQPDEKVAMLATPRPQTNPERVQPQHPAYHPYTEQNQIEGSISNRDSPGVDAVGTPLGRYQKKISDAIGPLWNYFYNNRRDLIVTGCVRIRFYIDQNGKVEDVKVISNDSNEALASCSVDSIYHAKFLPPPSELAPVLENGRYVETISFTVYP